MQPLDLVVYALALVGALGLVALVYPRIHRRRVQREWHHLVLSYVLLASVGEML